MKFTANVVTLPKEVVDAYLDALAATTDPILKEEDVPATVLQELLFSAASACRKSIVFKHLKALEEAGLFAGVSCIEFPGFAWTLGLKRLYATVMLTPSLIKTMAEDLAAERRDLKDFMNYLDICIKIELEAAVNTALKDAPEAAHRRLENAVCSIMQANTKFMLGVTTENCMRLLTNVKSNMDMQVDGGPLTNLDDDLSLIVPEPVIEL